MLQIKCPKCGSSEVASSGSVQLKHGLAKRYWCRHCDYHYSQNQPKEKFLFNEGKITEMVAQGMRMADLAKHLEVHNSTISMWIRNDTIQTDFLKKLKVRCLQLYLEQLDLRDIAKHLGISRGIVNIWIKKYKESTVTSLQPLQLNDCHYELDNRKKLFRYFDQHKIHFQTGSTSLILDTFVHERTFDFKILRAAQMYLDGVNFDLIPSALRVDRPKPFMKKVLQSTFFEIRKEQFEPSELESIREENNFSLRIECNAGNIWTGT